MINNLKQIVFILLFFVQLSVQAQEYYFKDYGPFDKAIPSPEEFLNYPIGGYHTRHDLVIAYIKKLAELSNKASIHSYGETYEKRPLVLLTISSTDNLQNLETIKSKHLEVVNTQKNITNFTNLPLIINLAYGVHGNEPSSTEAALLTAYTLVASKNPIVQNYLKEVVIFLDPTINPDGRDRHTNWVNNFRGDPLIADKYDIEHNEAWPRGRTNHYWFDLNRDLLLGVHKESIGRLNWYHQWYPNVVTDFHEMGTNSTYFFEPKNKSASLNPITPSENRDVLNKVFAAQYAKDLDKIHSLYFTDEVYDSTYPGYGSTYMDLQGSLALLFEQASSRGHLQETPTGEISFDFTIKNQFVSSMSTIEAAINNKNLLYSYQNKFFKDAITKAKKSTIKGYVFGEDYDKNRTKAFIDVLLKHQIEVYPLESNLTVNKKLFKANTSFVVPTEQKQYYMVQSLFETYSKYRDSVYYDTSAWSMVNFYNMKYSTLTKPPKLTKALNFETNKVEVTKVAKSDYAYIIPYDDYYAPAFLYQLQKEGIVVKISTKEFSIPVDKNEVSFNKGALLVAVADQYLTKQELFDVITRTSNEFKVQAYGVQTGFTIKGNGLGSRSFKTINKPKVMMLVEGSVSSYEAGEVWHLFEQRMKMPLVKVPERLFSRVDLERYNVIVLVSGNYHDLDKKNRERLKNWIAKGNTLITTARASSWAVKQKLVKESLVTADKDSVAKQRMDFEDKRGFTGKQNVGGSIFKVDLDITNPIAYGYYNRALPVYKNNNVWLSPSKDQFATIAKYAKNPHIDGYITSENLALMHKSASIIYSKLGKGRVVLFADNPNFRGAWYGTNKLFMNAIFFGSLL